MFWQRGYLLNQHLLTKLLIIDEDLSKYASLVFVLIFCLWLIFCFVPVCDKSSVTSSSTISNQLVAGSIIVRHMKSISFPSLPLSVYGPIRSTHRHSQGVSTTGFGGSFPYFSFRFLLIWHVLQFLTYDWTSILRFFQYIAALKVSSKRVWPGCCK